jgi:hypothetical protein
MKLSRWLWVSMWVSALVWLMSACTGASALPASLPLAQGKPTLLFFYTPA